MLKHVAPWHERYCQRHGIVYVPIIAHVQTRKIGRRDRRPEWQKPQVIVDWLSKVSEGDLVSYVDPDAVIVDDNVDIFDILPEDKDIGMCLSYYMKKPRYNNGVAIMRNSIRTFDLWKTCNEMGPGIGEIAHDEGRINRLIWAGHPVKLFNLPGEYNAFKYTTFDPSKVVIKAWHGDPRDTVERRVKETVWQLLERQQSLG